MYKQEFLINNINGDFMINEIMSKKIIFGQINDSIKDISNLMKKNNIGFIPIKNDNKYIGVITDRDICLAIPCINNVNNSIKSYITNNIIYIHSNSTIDEALKLMSKYKVKRLLVKEKDNIIGILSLSDILNYTNNINIMDTYKSIFFLTNNSQNNTPEIDDYYL